MSKCFILQCEDLVHLFREETQGVPLGDHDPREVVLQILFLLLNAGNQAQEDFHLLPDISRLRFQDELEANPTVLSKLRSACFNMACRLNGRIDAIKGFHLAQADSKPGDVFPYTVGEWRGHDIVLDHMPY